MKTCDCENCPLSWEESSCSEECDYGCLIYGDLYYGEKLLCKFPKWIKCKIAKRKQKKIDKEQARQCEDIGEWYEEILLENCRVVDGKEGVGNER